MDRVVDCLGEAALPSIMQDCVVSRFHRTIPLAMLFSYNGCVRLTICFCKKFYVSNIPEEKLNEMYIFKFNSALVCRGRRSERSTSMNAAKTTPPAAGGDHGGDQLGEAGDGVHSGAVRHRRQHQHRRRGAHVRQEHFLAPNCQVCSILGTSVNYSTILIWLVDNSERKSR